MTAPDRLKEALQGCADLDALSERARVPRKIGRIAAHGRPVSVNHYLRLAVAAGFDPFIEGRTIEPFRIGSFHKARFGDVVRHIRTERALKIREGAKHFGVSIRALSYIENGHDVCIDTVLTVCRAIGIHPFLFARDCFTAAKAAHENETRSAA